MCDNEDERALDRTLSSGVSCSSLSLLAVITPSRQGTTAMEQRAPSFPLFKPLKSARSEITWRALRHSRTLNCSVFGRREKGA